MTFDPSTLDPLCREAHPDPNPNPNPKLFSYVGIKCLVTNSNKVDELIHVMFMIDKHGKSVTASKAIKCYSNVN